MNELTLADLDMGTCLPQVLNTSKPTLDRRGTVCVCVCSSFLYMPAHALFPALNYFPFCTSAHVEESPNKVYQTVSTQISLSQLRP